MPCPTGALPYASSGAASKALTHVTGKPSHAKPRGDLVPYHCEECGQWHLTQRGVRQKRSGHAQFQRARSLGL